MEVVIIWLLEHTAQSETQSNILEIDDSGEEGENDSCHTHDVV